jgi:hypothetical protein
MRAHVGALKKDTLEGSRGIQGDRWVMAEPRGERCRVPSMESERSRLVSATEIVPRRRDTGHETVKCSSRLSQRRTADAR